MRENNIHELTWQKLTDRLDGSILCYGNTDFIQKARKTLETQNTKGKKLSSEKLETQHACQSTLLKSEIITLLPKVIQLFNQSYKEYQKNNEVTLTKHLEITDEIIEYITNALAKKRLQLTHFNNLPTEVKENINITKYDQEKNILELKINQHNEIPTRDLTKSISLSTAFHTNLLFVPASQKYLLSWETLTQPSEYQPYKEKEENNSEEKIIARAQVALTQALQGKDQNKIDLLIKSHAGTKLKVEIFNLLEKLIGLFNKSYQKYQKNNLVTEKTHQEIVDKVQQYINKAMLPKTLTLDSIYSLPPQIHEKINADKEEHNGIKDLLRSKIREYNELMNSSNPIEADASRPLPGAVLH